jgi:NAD(P)-dependent dehydrogenase (short-subunit alcohol dehydrogenase family)/sugar phosphate isomerase/epimerase
VDLGLYTDSVASHSLEQAADLAVEIGATSVELATGGQSPAPHLRIRELLEDPAALRRFVSVLDDRNLRIAALNCSAWPLHPTKDAAHRALIRQTIELAQRLDVDTIVTMSGCPGDAAEDTSLNWIWYPWPDDAVALLERQWDHVIRAWDELASFAVDHGVDRIAMELHPLHLVYNVHTLRRLRDAVGPAIGANLDPSHLFWQQMDPVAAVDALADCLYHVHLKDSEVIHSEAALAGVLDNRPFTDPKRRAWVFRTVGRAHDAGFWRRFLRALADAGYERALSIENEDVEQPQELGVREAAAFIGEILDGAPSRPAQPPVEPVAIDSATGELADHVALVCGGAGGIGRATARRLASDGAAVFICDADADACESAIAELRAEGLRVDGLAARVNRSGELAGVVDAVCARYGGLDILVNSVGIQRYGTVVETDEDAWDEVLDVNLKAAYLASKLAIPAMRRRGGGSIVHVSSVQAFAAQAGAAAYAASKGGLNALTRALAVDHAADGIRVNAVCPGSVATPMLTTAADRFAPDGDRERLIEEWGAMHPVGRVASSEEVAAAIAFLAGPRASFITGSELKVDGGLLAQVGVTMPKAAAAGSAA